MSLASVMIYPFAIHVLTARVPGMQRWTANTAMDADVGGLLAHPARRGSSPTLTAAIPDCRGVQCLQRFVRNVANDILTKH